MSDDGDTDDDGDAIIVQLWQAVAVLHLLQRSTTPWQLWLTLTMKMITMEMVGGH